MQESPRCRRSRRLDSREMARSLGFRLARAALPSPFDLDADIVRVVGAGVTQCVTDCEVHRLDGEGSCPVYHPVEANLAIASGIGTRPPGSVRNRYVGLGVNRIRCVLAPLSRSCEHKLQ